MRRVLLLTALVAAGCERWEAPQYAASQVVPAEVAEVSLPGGGAVRFIRDPRPRDRGPQLAIFQGGQLRLQNGCLLLDEALIIWPRDARLDVSTVGRIAIVDEGGTAIVGEYLSPTGGPRGEEAGDHEGSDGAHGSLGEHETDLSELNARERLLQPRSDHGTARPNKAPSNG